MNYLLLILVFLISCSQPKPSNNSKKNSNSEFNKSYNKYLQRGDLDSARFYIDIDYDKAPDDLQILRSRGEVYFLLNKFEIAEQSWLSCLLINENDEGCYEKLIGLYCGVFDLMGNDCTDIIANTFKVNNQNKVALLFEAQRFVFENKINQAISVYENLLDIDSTNLRAMNELAILYDTSYKSEFYYNKILELDSSYVAYYGLGMYFQKKELYQKAINNYQKALSVSIKKEPYYNIGYCHLMLDESSKAVDSFSESIIIDASYVEAYFARGFAYERLRQNKLAIEDYKFCLMLEPGYEDARIQLEKLK